MNFMHILDPIIHPLQAVLVFLTGALHSYGLAIIIFTIIVRGALAPLNLRQLKSAKKMSALGPRIKEIQQRYKGDREAITREQMALYKEEGVNPAAGCLPLLIQMPVLYSLFFIFQNLSHVHGAAGNIYHAHFLWFTLNKPDGLFGHFLFGGAQAAWGPLPLLAAGTQWVQQRMMMQPTSDPQQRSTQQIMQFMPLLIMLFAVNYPAGLALYWVTSTVFSIVMQYFITGWGQLFKSPFKVPEAPAAAVTPARRQAVSEPRANATNAKANGSGINGAGRRATFFTAPSTGRASDDGDGGTDGEGQLANGRNGTRQGQGKMQRTVARQKARSSKGARR